MGFLPLRFTATNYLESCLDEGVPGRISVGDPLDCILTFDTNKIECTFPLT
jgi:hypothetical protein